MPAPSTIHRSLLRKASDLRTRHPHLRLVRPGEAVDEDGISADERAQILQEIDGIVAHHGLADQATSFASVARKRGVLMPVLVNVVAILVIGAAAIFFWRVLNRQEEQLVVNSAALESTEGRLLAALRQESEQQLAAKELAIQSIQSKLSNITAERERLVAETDARIQQTEQQLRAVELPRFGGHGVKTLRG